MGGGTFQPGVEKTRPGLYMNFESAAMNRIAVGERGTTTLPLVLNWGAPRTFVAIEEQSDVYDHFGYDVNHPAVIDIREAKKRAQTVLVYRLNEGTPAEVTWGSTVTTTVTAQYGGTRGNDIQIVVAANPVTTSQKDVSTLVDNRVVDVQTVATIGELQANAWVTFSGAAEDVPEDTAGVSLSGGTNGSVMNQDYTDYLSATETQFFDTIGYPVEDAALKTSFVSFIQRMRNDEGKKIVGVLPNETDADHEGIISVKNGVVLADGSSLDAVGAVAWTAGASAGAAVTTSLTYSSYEGAVDVDPRHTHSEIVAALQDGSFLFVHDGQRVKVEQDINTLTTYTAEKSDAFGKNRVIRTLDTINNDLKREFSESFIGKVDNNADGHALLKSAVTQYLNVLQESGAIQNVDADTDIMIDAQKSSGDQVYVDIAVQPVDSMEKFYFTVGVH